MNGHLTTLRFYLISAEARAYLVCRSADGKSVTVEMSQSRPGFWFADVPLAEGSYRLRYYCGDERQVVYHGPAATNGSWRDGLDAVVAVRARPPMVAAAMTGS